jgi:NAD(P)-dependent dehydrogenase (short-subunit alcohol dehydrogenase family)
MGYATITITRRSPDPHGSRGCPGVTRGRAGLSAQSVGSRQIRQENNAIVKFPYPEIESLHIPENLSVTRLSLPRIQAEDSEEEIVRKALSAPIDTAPLRQLARCKRGVLIVAKDLDFSWTASPDEALEMALEMTREQPDIPVLKAAFFCCQEAPRTMVERKRGKIITIASAAAKIGGVAVDADYSASKAGIICLTKSLALYAAPFGINVNYVYPEPTETAMTDAWGEAINTEFAKKIPFKRYGTQEEIAEVIVFLASERAI